ncbi:MAG: hypothetical protein ACRDE7_06730 [Sphingobacterium sp.]
MEQYYSTIEELREHWYDSTDNVCPYKLVSGGQSQRFAFGDIAMDAFEAEEGTAILFDHSDQQTKVLKYKFVEK